MINSRDHTMINSKEHTMINSEERIMINSKDETYNGWANRETWALVLHVSNDEGLDAWMRAELDHAARRGEPQDDAARETAETMFTAAGYRDHTGHERPASLIMASEEIGSLWRVDWQAVAEAFRDSEVADLQDSGALEGMEFWTDWLHRGK